MPVPQPMRSSSRACTGLRVRASLRTSAIDRNMALGPQAKTWSAHERWPARRSVTGPRWPALAEPGGAAAADVVEDGELALAVAFAEAVEAHGARQQRVVAVGAVDHEEAAGRRAAGDGRAGEPHEEGILVELLVGEDAGGLQLHGER